MPGRFVTRQVYEQNSDTRCEHKGHKESEKYSRNIEIVAPRLWDSETGSIITTNWIPEIDLGAELVVQALLLRKQCQPIERKIVQKIQ